MVYNRVASRWEMVINQNKNYIIKVTSGPFSRSAGLCQLVSRSSGSIPLTQFQPWLLKHLLHLVYYIITYAYYWISWEVIHDHKEPSLMNTSYLLILVVFDKLSLNVFSWDDTASYVHSQLSDNYIYARRNGWERRQTGDTQLYVYTTECKID